MIEMVAALGDIDRRLAAIEEKSNNGWIGFGDILKEMNENMRALTRVVTGSEVAPVLELHERKSDDGETPV